MIQNFANQKIINSTKTRGGFTLIELVVVIAIIAILITIVVEIINPVQKIKSAYRAAQSSDMLAINRAIQQFFVDNKSYSPLNIPSVETEICNTGFWTHEETSASSYASLSKSCESFVDLSMLVPTYLAAIPQNPEVMLDDSNGKIGSGYLIKLSGRQIELNTVNTSEIAPPNFDWRIFNFDSVNRQILILVFLIILIILAVTYFAIRRAKSN